jgi:hypothetical protein
VDALNAEGCVLYIDFLEFIEEKIRESRNHLDVDDIVYWEIGFHLFRLVSHDIEILVALADGEGGCPWEEFMAEDFSDEDVLGHVFWFKAVAADSGVGAAEVAWFPGLVQGAEGSRNVFGELRAGGGVDGIWGGEAL